MDAFPSLVKMIFNLLEVPIDFVGKGAHGEALIVVFRRDGETGGEVPFGTSGEQGIVFATRGGKVNRQLVADLALAASLGESLPSRCIGDNTGGN